MSYNNKNRQTRAELTKQKIYESAETLCAEKGYDSVSVDEIVRHAGIAKGSFYLHFESKDMLIYSLVADKIDKIDMKYSDFIDNLPGEISVKEKTLLLIDFICDALINEVGYAKMRALYKTQLSILPIANTVSGYQRRIYAIFRNILEQGKAHGELRTDSSPDIIARHLMSAIRGITYEWCVRYPDFDYKAQAKMYFAFLLNGL